MGADPGLAATVAVASWLDEPPLARTGGATAAGTGATGTGTGTGGTGSAAAQDVAPNPLRRPDIWRIAFTAFLLNLPQFTVLTFGTVFLATQEHLSVGTIAALLVAVQALGGVSRVAGGRWTDRRGGHHRRRMVTVYSRLVAGGFEAIASYQVLPAAAVTALIVVTGSLACGWHGVHYAEIATMAGAERAGTALGLENTMVFGGAFAAPLLIPAVLAATSWSGVMLVVGALPAVVAAVLMPRELLVTASGAGR